MPKTLWDTIAEHATLQAKFEAFDREHPEIWDLYVKFAREVKAAGHRRFSSDALLHRLRWHCAVNMNRAEGELKINDHWSSRYARRLLEKHPEEFAGFFELRNLRVA